MTTEDNENDIRTRAEEVADQEYALSLVKGLKFSRPPVLEVCLFCVVFRRAFPARPEVA